MFDAIQWADDDSGFTIGSVDFRVEQLLTDEERGDRTTDYLRFFKPRPMVEQYEQYFQSRPGWVPRSVFELGIWEGGSVVFWSELLHPELHVAIDYLDRDDPEQVRRYVSEHPEREIQTRWNVDQADPDGLHELLASLGQPHFDLIIDDASHKYRQTVASFNALFPTMASGGAYVIEDWSWCFDEEFLRANPAWRDNPPLAPIVMDLAHLAATDPDYVAEISVHRDFVVARRGRATSGAKLEQSNVLQPRSLPRWRSWMRRARARTHRGLRSLRERAVASRS